MNAISVLSREVKKMLEMVKETSPYSFYFVFVTDLVSESIYPSSSSDSTASVHTMSVFTRCPISL